MTDTETTKPGKGAWVAHNLNEPDYNNGEHIVRWFHLFGSELAARRYAMGVGNAAVTVERLTWGEGRSE